MFRTVPGIALFLALTTAAQADVSISARKTKNMSCVAGVCSPMAKGANLNVNDLATMLASSDIRVTTGAGAVTIQVSDPLIWASANKLILDAIFSIGISQSVTVGGSGGLKILVNDGGTGGDLRFSGAGNVTFWDTSSILVINGKTYKLVNDLPTLAQDILDRPTGLFALARDYDAAQDGTYSGSPIARKFAGVFEGLGHTISNLTINASAKSTGLFQEADGTLRDISLSNVSLTAAGGGALAGTSNGVVAGCHATGAVAVTYIGGGLLGTANVVIGSSADVSITGGPSTQLLGGLLGDDEFSGGSIINSYSTGPVTGGVETGGLVGSLSQGTSVAGSYATGAVTGDQSTGGLAGENGGRIEDSYASGAVLGVAKNAGGLVGMDYGLISDSFATGAVTSASYAGGFVGEVDDGSSLQSSYSTGAVQGGSRTQEGGFLGAALSTNVIFSDVYWDTTTSGEKRKRGYGSCADMNSCTSDILAINDNTLKSALPSGFDPGIWGQSASINNGYPYLLANPPQ